MVRERAALDEKINHWLAANAGAIEIDDIVIRQSSDEAFHCLSITIFYKRKAPKR
jgi:hypothetical protein